MSLAMSPSKNGVRGFGRTAPAAQIHGERANRAENRSTW
jgi:hypothetical protein